jgi:hypothetical protein
MATLPLNMSYDTNPFVDETFGINLKVFTPLLKKDLTQSTPPFTIANPLKEDNFCNINLDGEVPYLVTLNETIHNLNAGFLNPNRELSHLQWLCLSSQLLSAMLYSLSKFVPGMISPPPSPTLTWKKKPWSKTWARPSKPSTSLFRKPLPPLPLRDNSAPGAFRSQGML